MRIFHLSVVVQGQKEQTFHVNADMVEALCPEDDGCTVIMASGGEMFTRIPLETVLKRIAEAQAVHKKNGDE